MFSINLIASRSAFDNSFDGPSRILELFFRLYVVMFVTR